MLPSSIPTSFIPHPGGAPTQRFRPNLVGAFSFLAYGILGLVLLCAIGVFFYGQLLASDEAAKSATLTEREAAVDPATVESFVRLRDRLASGKKLLTEHVAFSGFFSSLGGMFPTTVRLSLLHLSFDAKGIVRLDGSGTAKNFNALAAASTAFAKDGRLKDAIFSNITIQPKDGSVSFALSASLDPRVVSFSPTASATTSSITTMPKLTASSTAATSTSTAATSTLEKKP